MDAKHSVWSRCADGAMSVEDAEQFFRRAPYEELGYAKLDTHRQTAVRLWRGGILQRQGRRISRRAFSKNWPPKTVRYWAPAPHPHQFELVQGRLPQCECMIPLARLYER